ncbi:hypothetical protein CDL15_Pgr021173 [Punica granatum]|uniref:Uncharacterized protein n=1 Tax=Punica granatum TaxID=22663 RepID=A0A218WJ60_PUNGR|nr:hypothetical protein CDL15_Pgr021173 [Punica granatum]
MEALKRKEHYKRIPRRQRRRVMSEEVRLEVAAGYKRSAKFQDLVAENNSWVVMKFTKAVRGEIKEKNPEVKLREYETF